MVLVQVLSANSSRFSIKLWQAQGLNEKFSRWTRQSNFEHKFVQCAQTNVLVTLCVSIFNGFDFLWKPVGNMKKLSYRLSGGRCVFIELLKYPSQYLSVWLKEFWHSWIRINLVKTWVLGKNLNWQWMMSIQKREYETWAATWYYYTYVL